MRGAHRVRWPVLVVALALAALLSSPGCGGADDGHAPSPSPPAPGPRACIVGADGAILLTTDGGAHWQRRPSGTREALLDVAFADERSGWAVGSNGTILHTSDGGVTWIAQRSGFEGTEISLSEVVCQSPTMAWVIDLPFVVLRTTDGGAHWSRVTLEEEAEARWPVVPSAFANPQVGWSGSRMKIWVTRDGGAHWSLQWRQAPGPRAHGVGRIVCADTEHVWAGGDYGTALPGEAGAAVLGSSDGGRTWKRQLETPSPLTDLWCTDARHVWVLAEEFLYRSTDGGAHWRRVHAFPYGTYGLAIAFSDARHGWLVVERRHDCNLILVTEDGGVTWRPQARVEFAVSEWVNDMVAF